MNHKQELKILFYQFLGKLFYAIASCDKNVQIDEVNKLRQIIRNEWLEIDMVEDEFETDAAYQIEIEFDWLVEQAPDFQKCYAEFETFFRDNNQLFSPKINDLILETSGAIASSFSGKNKSELVMLTNLTSLLRS